MHHQEKGRLFKGGFFNFPEDAFASD